MGVDYLRWRGHHSYLTMHRRNPLHTFYTDSAAQPAFSTIITILFIIQSLHTRPGYSSENAPSLNDLPRHICIVFEYRRSGSIQIGHGPLICDSAYSRRIGLGVRTDRPSLYRRLPFVIHQHSFSLWDSLYSSSVENICLCFLRGMRMVAERVKEDQMVKRSASEIWKRRTIDVCRLRLVSSHNPHWWSS